jgi:transcriptional regulator with XRE-family HTH domain
VLRLRVKEVAQAKRMSMNKLSQISQVSYHVVQDIYRNPFRIVSTDTINRLAEALDVPATELLEDISSPNLCTQVSMSGQMQKLEGDLEHVRDCPDQSPDSSGI